MTVATKDLIRELYRSIDHQDPTAVGRYMAADYRLHVPGAPPLDANGFTGWMQGFFTAFPDVSHTIEDLIHDGDLGVVRLTIRGTNTGSFQGMPPTGRPIEIGAINFLRIAGGKVAEQWIQADFLAALRQLGVIPAPGQ